ncbi:MAG: hypothetical protein H0W07_10145 [Chloroflexi bacterium]|nr:hypothetical protein [Chloroflexota bacterium]
MTDPTRYPGPGAGTDPESASRLRGWLKVLAIAVLIVALLVVAMMLVGGGGHTPPPGAH